MLRSPDARVVSLTDNRVYNPQRGIWWQRDPNATGLLTQGSLTYGGCGFEPGIGVADVSAQYVDGLNVTLAFGANAVEHTDPTGLFLGSLLAAEPTVLGTVTKDLGIAVGAMQLVSDLQQVLAGQQSALGFAADVAINLSGAKLFDLAFDQFQNARRYLRASRNVQPAIVTMNRSFGEIAEDYVRAALGGTRKQYQTSQGARVIDSVSEGLGVEVKTGTQSASAAIRSQVAKDAELLRARRFDRIEWQFFDGRTGNPGRPSGPLRELLEEAGITIREMGPVPLP